MEPSYSHSWSLKCVLEGPLASHISSFTKSLDDQGYCARVEPRANPLGC